MRIEPTSRSQARQQTTRRHSAETVNVANKTRPVRQNASAQGKPNTNLVPVTVPSHATYQHPKSVRRWRAHVPFLAHYIGQETAKETPARAIRRNPEKAQKAYEIRAKTPVYIRTLAQV